MIICQCTGISDRDIRAAVAWMRAADPGTLVTAAKIYRALGKQADCGTCLPLFLDAMASCDGLKPTNAPPNLSPLTQRENGE